jgi:hypothetical protein
MNVKLEHNTSISANYIKDKGSILLRHFDNLTEYTISTQKTKSKTFTVVKTSRHVMGRRFSGNYAFMFKVRNFILVKNKGTLD